MEYCLESIMTIDFYFKLINFFVGDFVKQSYYFAPLHPPLPLTISCVNCFLLLVSNDKWVKALGINTKYN